MIPSQENLVETNLKNYLVVYSIVYSRLIFDLFISFNEKHRYIKKKKSRTKHCADIFSKQQVQLVVLWKP